MENNCAGFFSAIEKGDVTKVTQLLGNDDMYKVVNLENEEGKTAFQVALEKNHYGE